MGNEQISRRPLTTRDTKWAKSTARWLGNMGLRPNAISILSVGFACLAGAAFIGAGRTAGLARAGLFLAAALGIQLRLLCNLFDGMVAVEGGFKTKSGEVYNELPDRFSDAVILVGVAYAAPGSEVLHALGWLAAVLSIITAYVRALGASAGTAQHFVGPMAKPQRMALLTVLCVVMAILVAAGQPLNLVHPTLALISAGCLLTIARRTRLVVRELESK
ncbi:MAG: CDP-alcohol phosphatidyltransferase family protein [Victivallales bacterium]|jgi:phosphatidylglycerophosphate synthase|nr:CDP-alcohol phosphatidyltransferase family protein [Victivallales bacterium]MBT7165915.1 CDP-alcohol phosphatidyltransferase family protein [Victivallales bacterium]